MTTALELIRVVEAAGGRFLFDGDRLGIEPAEADVPILDELRRHKPELMAEFARRETVADDGDFDALDDLRQPFVDWFDTSICLEVEWLARRRPGPLWCAGPNPLHAAFCRWMFERDQVPPVLEEFRHLLEELCCDIRLVCGEQFVLGISLKEDVQATAKG